jgi:hypothetical protein
MTTTLGASCNTALLLFITWDDDNDDDDAMMDESNKCRRPETDGIIIMQSVWYVLNSSVRMCAAAEYNRPGYVHGQNTILNHNKYISSA